MDDEAEVGEIDRKVRLGRLAAVLVGGLVLGTFGAGCIAGVAEGLHVAGMDYKERAAYDYCVEDPGCDDESPLFGAFLISFLLLAPAPTLVTIRWWRPRHSGEVVLN